MNIAIGGVRGIPARYGGFETSADETSRRMKELGHQVSVYCRTRPVGDIPREYAGIRLIYLKGASSSNLETIAHSIAIGFHVLFRGSDVDVVHLYNAASSFGGLIVRLAGKPLIMTLDGVEWEREKWGPIARMVWRALTWLAVRVANIAVCDSQTVKEAFENQYKRKLQFIPYGAKPIKATSRDYENFGLKQFQYYIFVGRLVPEKDVDLLLDAYARLSTDIPLVIVGDNEKDSTYTAMLRSKAGVNVKFVGYRYGNEYESLLTNARAYVTASKLEGTSPSLLAAMGAQVCCLARSIPENRETGGDSMLYFDGTIEDLVEKLRWISVDDEIVREFALKGYKRVSSHYDWNAVTEQYLAAYGDVCGFDSSASAVSSADRDEVSVGSSRRGA